MHFTYCVLALLLANLTVCHARTFTSSDGRSLEAIPLSADLDSIVVIHSTTGRIFDIPFERLSEADRAFAEAFTPPERLPVPPLEEAIFTISGPKGNGSGFLVQSEGRVHLYTNQHVISGTRPENLELDSAAGESLPAGPLEIDPGRDVARILVPATKGLIVADTVTLDEAIACYGNSQGAGVVTRDEGKVLGVGADNVEVDAEIVPGNSGGPIVNHLDEVVGVATYVKRGQAPGANNEEDEKDRNEAEEKAHWTIQGTRYTQTRRFGLNLTGGTEWLPVDWNRYYELSTLADRDERLVQQWRELTVGILGDPFVTYSTSNYLDNPIITNLIEIQNEESRQRYNYTNDQVSGRRLATINRKVRDDMVRQFNDSAAQLMASLKDSARTFRRARIPYFIQLNEDRQNLTAAWKRYIVHHAHRRNAFKFR